ncbi:MAG: hypothetical protein HZB26_18745 [Candidatus Hydrogenedentes bacterium]|nr:hypothetical protein [Candidatus Hydrogenedentota bacterium]
MKAEKFIPVLFWIAAAYDGILGVAFLLFPDAPFTWFSVPPPNHFAYVRFPAGLLIVFALMFIAVARKPAENRQLIPYGILLKVCYCGNAFGYWVAQGIPGMWKPFAVLDLAFGVLFYLAYQQLAPKRP